jgi:hypothetical protein
MRLFSVLLVMGALLLFGCTTHYEADYNASINGSAGSQNVTTVPSGAQPTGAMNTTPPTGTSPPITPPSSGADLSGKNYTELLLLGSPSQCSVTFSNDQRAYDIALFFDGKGSMRVEDPKTNDPECPLNVMIFKGDMANGGVAYMNCPTNKGLLGNEFGTDTPCDWLSTDISSKYGGIGSFSWGIVSYTTLPLDMVSDDGYACKPWAAESSKFDTPGHACAQ